MITLLVRHLFDEYHIMLRLIYTAFITWRGGWGWKNFLSECNTGRGVKMPSWGLNYYRFVVPVVIFLLIVNCYYAIFAN